MTIQIPLKVKTRYVHGEMPDPSEVTIGELLINSADGTLWTKKNDGTIHDIVTAGGMAPNIYDPDNIEENVYDRSNHIGTQSTDTIYDFANVARAAAPVQSVQGREGDVTITKSDVGLGNVNNTSDANKPVSAQQAFFVANKITEHENSTDPHHQYREATDAVDERVDSLESDLEDISDLTTLLSEKVDLSYVDAAFPTVVDNIFASVDDLPVIDGSSISKIFVVDGIAYTLGVDIDNSSGDAQYIQSWKAKAKVKSGQLIKNLADGLFYKFEASSWIQSAAPDTMAYISDTSGKIFTDPIIIDGIEDLSDLDHLITPGFYVLHNASYFTGSQITVVATPTPWGTLYSQIIYAIIAGLVYSRYRFDEDGEPPGEWSPIQTSISQVDIDQWSSSYTYEQPNAVLTYDYDEGKYTVKKSSAVLVPEAPSDGKTYGRKDAGWVEVTSSATSSVVSLLEVSGASHAFVKADVNKYTRYTSTGAKMATFDSSEGFEAGDEIHITNRAASDNLTISGTGITFNAPKGGTLVLEPADTVTVKFVSPTEADVMGSVVAA